MMHPELFSAPFHSGAEQYFLSGITNCSCPQAGKSVMNTINRNVYPVSGLSTQSVNPDSDGIQPPDVKSGHNSQLIDFSSPQQVNGLQSSLSLSGSRPQVPATRAASDASENPVELLLNKLVEAIRNILKDLLSLFKGDQQQDQAPPLHRLNASRHRASLNCRRRLHPHHLRRRRRQRPRPRPRPQHQQKNLL